MPFLLWQALAFSQLFEPGLTVESVWCDLDRGKLMGLALELELESGANICMNQ
jgi:hypothetical protein